MKRCPLRFGVFEIDLDSGQLTKRGARVKLHDKPFQVLAALLQRPGEVVTREELRSRMWPDHTFVDFDNNLNAAVRKLRSVLGDSASSPRFVETLPKRGYRFIGPVEDVVSPETTAKTRRVGVLLAMFLVLAVITVWSFDLLDPKSSPASVAIDKELLLVAPFQNLDNDPEREYFCDGLTEEMITQLGRLQPERLGVIARISSMTYKDTDKTVGQIGEELGVDYVLEGSVRSDADRMRITVQLIQVSDQTHLWAETYDAEFGDLLTIQGDVSVEVAGVLALELLPDRPLAHARAGTRVTAAYEQYLRGRHEWNTFTGEGYRRAIGNFERAIELDPNFAAAHSGLADAYNLLAFTSDVLPGEAFPHARDAAAAALTIDDRSAEAHNSMGFVELYDAFDFDEADRHFARAIELSPNYAMAYHWRAGALSVLERHDEAIAAMRLAVELDPVSLSLLSDAGWYYLFADRYDEAIDECKRTLAIAEYGWAEACLFVGYEKSGRFDEALELVRDGWDAASDPEVAAALALPDAESTLAALQQVRLKKTLEDEGLQQRYPVELALAHAAAGDIDGAFEWLERAWEIRDGWLIFLRVDPRLDQLHGDPRYEELSARIGLRN
jgi:TolB-like protein/DNA-binding winged helix-turn-helix (wHTH) protein/tetratricopeptide (TPR) repeat protein